MDKKKLLRRNTGVPRHSNEWAITVNELETGEFYFSLLRAIDRSDDLLGYRPDFTGQTAHARPLDAWIAGIVALRNHAPAKKTLGVPATEYEVTPRRPLA